MYWYSKVPGKTEEMSWHEPHDVQHEVQIPAPEEENLYAPVYSGGQPDGKQLWRKGPEDPGGNQVQHEPAVHFCFKDQLYPGLH